MTGVAGFNHAHPEHLDPMNTLRTPQPTGVTGLPGPTGPKDEPAAGSRLHPDCKSVLVSNEAFNWLRQFQASTSPRLELRYLLEAAVDLVRAQPALATQLERQARDRLKHHLVSLD